MHSHSDAISTEDYAGYWMPSVIKNNGNIFLEKIVSGLCKKMTSSPDIEFYQVTDEDSYINMITARKRMYSYRASYFEALISSSGAEKLDGHSYIFVASLHDEIIGTVRLTKYPFEVNSYIASEEMANFLGGLYKDKYLEISRLLVDKNSKVKGLGKSLTVYASLITYFGTNYSSYLSIARPEVINNSFDYKFDKDFLRLCISERNNNEYHVTKGNFYKDLVAILDNYSDVSLKELLSGKNDGQ